MKQLVLLALLVMFTASCQNQVKTYPDSNQAVQQTAASQDQPSIVQGPEIPTNPTYQYKGPVPILMYHSINRAPESNLEIPPQVFQAEMEHLMNSGYSAISFVDLQKWKRGEPIPDKPILITFDDGYLDNYTLAYPILKKLRIKATLFVVTDLVGKTNYLNWDQLQEMDQSGWIEIGAHTRHHVDLTKQTKAVLEKEVLGSKRILEERLGHGTLAFAYPSGRYNDIVVEAVQRAGFEFSVTTKPGYAEKEQGFWTLHRIRVSGSQPAAVFMKQFP